MTAESARNWQEDRTDRGGIFSSYLRCQDGIIAYHGMPSWSGFLSEDEVRNLYGFVKGRSLDLVPAGRPPSEMD